MKKTVLATALFMAMGSAYAAPLSLEATSNFVMYDGTGAVVGGAPAGTLTGFIDTVAMTWNVASTLAFFGLNWTASGGTLYAPGTYTVNVNGDGAVGLGAGDVTFTVGAGQVGGNINFAWGATAGIDVFNVWDVSIVGAVTTYTSTDFDILYNGAAVAGDSILGVGMVDGPFPGFSANFNVATVPVPATAWIVGSGLLGLMGVGSVRRKKQLAA